MNCPVCGFSRLRVTGEAEVVVVLEDGEPDRVIVDPRTFRASRVTCEDCRSFIDGKEEQEALDASRDIWPYSIEKA